MTSVFIDGRFAGATPLTVRDVTPGDHFLKLTRHGYQPWNRVIRVLDKTDAVHVKLVGRPSGSLRIESVPANANAYVSGEFRGRTPVVVGELCPGKVPVRIEKGEFVTWQGEADVPNGRPGALSAVLQSRVEAYLKEEIERYPEVVVNYCELGHFYVTRHDFDRAMEVYARGMDACMMPGAAPNDCLRLYNELNYLYHGTIILIGDQATVAALRERLVKLYEEGIRRTPDNERNYWALAAIEQESSRWDRCVRLYEQALTCSRTERVHHRNVRGAAMATYHYALALQPQKAADALAAYEDSIRKYAPATYTMFSLANAIGLSASPLQKPEKTQELRRLHIRLFPHAPASQTYQAAIAQQFESAGRTEDAIAEYETYLQMFPDSDSCPSIVLAIARLYATKLNNSSEGLVRYMRCLARYPEFDGCAGALKSAAALCDQLKFPEEAARLRTWLLREFPRSAEASEIETDPAARQRRADATGLLQKAQSFEAQDTPQAVQTLEQVLQHFPRTSQAVDALSRIISIHETKTKDTEKELAARRQQIDLFGDDDRAPIWLNALAGRLATLKQDTQAAEAYRRLLRTYPDSDLCPAVHSALASLYYQTIFDQQKAVEEYRKVVDRYPDAPEAPMALYQIGWSYFLHQKGKEKEAIAAFQELLKRYPLSSAADNVEYWLDALLTGPQTGAE
jgi:tetratricopeptide (TPR) repeat protein